MILPVVASITAGVAIVACVAHVGFAFGLGSAAGSSTIPVTAEGKPLFEPGPLVTMAVAVLLAAFAALLLVAAWSESEAAPVRVLLWAAVLILAARVVGDGRHVGLTKRVRGTRFSHLDDRVFTPIVAGLVLGALAALAA